jgi:hypothetical protein
MNCRQPFSSSSRKSRPGKFVSQTNAFDQLFGTLPSRARPTGFSGISDLQAAYSFKMSGIPLQDGACEGYIIGGLTIRFVEGSHTDVAVWVFRRRDNEGSGFGRSGSCRDRSSLSA